MASSLGGSIQRKKFFSQAFEICNKPVFTSYYSWRNEISVRGYPGENNDIHSRVAVRLGAEGQQGFFPSVWVSRSLLPHLPAYILLLPGSDE